MPEISIIVPSFNEEKNISRCLDSILNQTFGDFEIICVDDNSTDDTFNILKDYSLKDERIKIFKNPEKGVAAARNFGISKMTANYLGFVDSDDFIQPQMFEFLYQTVKENDCEMAVCGYERFRDIEIKNFDYNCRECTCDEFISFTNTDFVLANEMKVSSVCCKLFSKKLLSNELKFESYAIGEDTLFCSELWIRSNKTFLVDLPLYGYMINSNSVTHVSYADKKWIDLIVTRFLAYENYLKYKNDKTSAFYLEKGISLLNFYTFFSYKTETEKFYKAETKKLYKKYLLKYLKLDYISVKSKILFVVFYNIPFLYRIYRKKYYGNER